MLEIKELTRVYGRFTALNRLSIQIGDGELHGFVGPNGAGKSTTMRILATLLSPTSGTAVMDGVDVRKAPRRMRELIGYMPDFFGVYDRLKTWEYLDFYARCYGFSYQERMRMIDQLLELVRLQSPDLIALTGDLADEFTDFSMLPPLLDGLTALAPTFYVTGNHEWVLSREKREVLFSMLDAAGVVRLQNEYRLLKKGQASIVLAGVDDPNGPYDQKRPAQLVREIRQQYGKDAYILMLSHRNDELPLWAHMGVQTVLCGHGHGGIVRLPGIGAVFGTHMDLFPDYTAGLYEKDGTAMVVSRGLGGSRKLPLRIGNRPEVVTVVLRTEN